ncbi:MAG: ATP-binding protein [bacterium]
MQLVALDMLVASWVLQLALGTVFLIALWGIAHAFRRGAVVALAAGWSLYTFYMMVSLSFAVAARSNASHTATLVLGTLEGLGILAMFAFWQPVAALLAGARSNPMPSRRSQVICGLFAATVVVVNLGANRPVLYLSSGPFQYLYPVAYTWLAVSAWRLRRHAGINRQSLLWLGLGFFTFVVRLELNRDVVLRDVDYAHASSSRLLVVALIQTVQVVSFGAISLIVALAVERSAILQQSERLRHVEARLEKSRRLESLGEMAARIAHDFNNILAVISIGVQLARRVEASPAEVASELTSVAHATERAGELIRQLLAFANPRVDAAKAASALEVNAYFERSAHMLRRLMSEGVTLQIDAADRDAWVAMDASQFEQVMMNLVVNARDAMPAGGAIKVELATEIFASSRVLFEDMMPAGSYLRTSVHDSGSGIDPEVLPRIFDPFFTTKGDDGTGLGLATVYAIVHRARGDVAVHSVVGHGTRFDVYLPLLPTPSSQVS